MQYSSPDAIDNAVADRELEIKVNMNLNKLPPAPPESEIQMIGSMTGGHESDSSASSSTESSDQEPECTDSDDFDVVQLGSGEIITRAIHSKTTNNVNQPTKSKVTMEASKLISKSSLDIIQEDVSSRNDSQRIDDDATFWGNSIFAKKEKKTETEVELPTGPSFKDEIEFEKEMESNKEIQMALQTSISGLVDSNNSLESDDDFSFDESLLNFDNTSFADFAAEDTNNLIAKDKIEQEKIIAELQSSKLQSTRMERNSPNDSFPSKSKSLSSRLPSKSLASIASLGLESMTMSNIPDKETSDCNTTYSKPNNDNTSIKLNNNTAEYVHNIRDKSELLSLHRKYKVTSENTLLKTSSVMKIECNKNMKLESFAEEDEEDEEDNSDYTSSDQNMVDTPSSIPVNHEAKTPSSIDAGCAVLKDLSQNDWKMLQAEEERESRSSKVGGGGQVTYVWTDHDTAKAYFEYLDTSKYKNNIISEDFSGYSKMAKLRWKIDNKPRIKYGDGLGAKHRDLIFIIAKIPLIVNDSMPEMHHRILQTIYKRITNTKKDVPKSGSAWLEIGFQSGNPGTDLRSTGMFSMLQILFMLEHFPRLVRNIWHLSRDHVQQFPFMATSIKLTLFCIVSLRKCYLSSMCNEAKDVFNVCHVFYMSLMLSLYDTWLKEKHTINSMGGVLKKLEQMSQNKKSIKLLVDKFELWEKKLSSGDNTGIGTGIAFTDLEYLKQH